MGCGGNDIPEGSIFFGGKWSDTMEWALVCGHKFPSLIHMLMIVMPAILGMINKAYSMWYHNERESTSNMTSMYSAGDTGFGMDGYHYWSYQGATNADNDGLGINYGTSPVQCARPMKRLFLGTGC